MRIFANRIANLLLNLLENVCVALLEAINSIFECCFWCFLAVGVDEELRNANERVPDGVCCFLDTAVSVKFFLQTVAEGVACSLEFKGEGVFTVFENEEFHTLRARRVIYKPCRWFSRFSVVSTTLFLLRREQL